MDHQCTDIYLCARCRDVIHLPYISANGLISFKVCLGLPVDHVCVYLERLTTRRVCFVQDRLWSIACITRLSKPEIAWEVLRCNKVFFPFVFFFLYGSWKGGTHLINGQLILRRSTHLYPSHWKRIYMEAKRRSARYLTEFWFGDLRVVEGCEGYLISSSESTGYVITLHALLAVPCKSHSNNSRAELLKFIYDQRFRLRATIFCSIFYYESIKVSRSNSMFDVLTNKIV